jgi:hypothetical protein
MCQSVHIPLLTSIYPLQDLLKFNLSVVFRNNLIHLPLIWQQVPKISLITLIYSYTRLYSALITM